LLLFGNEQISCTLLLPILPNRILFCLALQSFGFLSGISPPVSFRGMVVVGVGASFMTPCARIDGWPGCHS
jgi:hypothetical protein